MKKHILLRCTLISTLVINTKIHAMLTPALSNNPEQRISQNTPVTTEGAASNITLPNDIFLTIFENLTIDQLAPLRKTAHFYRLLTDPLVLKKIIYPKLYTGFLNTLQSLENKKNPPKASPEELYWGRICILKLSQPAHAQEDPQTLRSHGLDIGKLYTMLKYFKDKSSKLEDIITDRTRFSHLDFNNQIPQGIIHAALDINILNEQDRFDNQSSLPMEICSHHKARTLNLFSSFMNIIKNLTVCPESFKTLLTKEISHNQYFLDFYVFETLLTEIISTNRSDLIPLIIKYGASANSRDYYGNTPLCTAISLHQNNCLKPLIEGKANIHARLADDATAVIIAIANNNPLSLKMLLEQGAKCDATYLPNNSNTLIIAAIEGNADCINLLLDKKMNVNAADNNGNTATHFAASNGHLASLKVLLNRGASTTQKTKRGETALSAAALRGQTQCLKELLHRDKSTVNLPNQWRNSPLLYAIMSGNIACASLLLHNGASMTVRGVDGNSPLHFATLSGVPADMTTLLLLHGADPKARNAEGDTPLHLAAGHSNNDCLQELVLCSDLEARQSTQNYGNTALSIAASQGTLECLKVLAAAGANVNAVNYYGNSPVMIAARDGHIECVQFLLEKGANIEYMNCEGKTARDLAKTDEIRNLILHYYKK